MAMRPPDIGSSFADRTSANQSLAVADIKVRLILRKREPTKPFRLNSSPVMLLKRTFCARRMPHCPSRSIVVRRRCADCTRRWRRTSSQTGSSAWVSIIQPYYFASRIGCHSHLQRALDNASSGSAEGERSANAVLELDRNRKAAEIQFAEFETAKRSLMRDLQNRCEKVSSSLVECAKILQVVELEMQLDEAREQYRIVARSANSRSQQRKMEILEYNVDALNAVQKQASPTSRKHRVWLKHSSSIRIRI